MAFNPPRRPVTRAAWRDGFWASRRRRGPAAAEAKRAGSLRDNFLAGYHEAEAQPGVYAPECWSHEELIKAALRFALQHAQGTVRTDDQRAQVEAMKEGWRDLLERTLRAS